MDGHSWEHRKMFDSILLNGTVGAGKSTLANAIGAREEANSRPHAVVDLDQIRRAWPAPKIDRFNHEVELRNLGDLVRNYRRAGAEHFILAGVIEDARQIPRYEDALQSSGLFVCRLVAPEATLKTRLQKRHSDTQDELTWHLGRVGELSAILDNAALDHLVLDSSRSTPEELAVTVCVAAGW